MEFRTRENCFIYIPRYRLQLWIDTPSLIDFSRAHLWRDWRWSRASLPSKRCQSPGETFFFFQNNLPTDFVSHGGRLVSNKSLLSPSYARVRIEFWVSVSRDCANEEDRWCMQTRAWNSRECRMLTLLSYFFLFFFFSNFPNYLSGGKNFFAYLRSGSGSKFTRNLYFGK